MMFILSLVRMFLGAAPSIAKTIADLEAKRAQATTDQEKDQLDAQIAELRAQGDLQHGSLLDDAQRALLVMPAEIYLWKVVVIDTVLKLGVTPDLSPKVWSIVMAEIGFFFLVTLVKK